MFGDIWYYPKDLGEDKVMNVFDFGEGTQINEYDLPDNWRDIVTNNNGIDNKPSIHDIMIAI